MSTDTRTPTDTTTLTLDRVTEADGRATALRAVSRAIRRAVFTVIVGASGSGDSASATGVGFVLQRSNAVSPR
ncbi:ABC-type lipoprotein export system ATPase subunit [Catenulispora sp. GP43]|uniref:hypothetical protein n=1 Tax=Catenulispora sp. GP43 TaxID=3156263 RepID=UPI0035124CC6